MINKTGAFHMTCDLQLTFRTKPVDVHPQPHPQNTITTHTNGADPKCPDAPENPKRNRSTNTTTRKPAAPTTPRSG